MYDLSKKSKLYALAAFTAIFLSMAGCGGGSSSASTTNTNSTANALPQPSVDCGGSSCID